MRNDDVHPAPPDPPVNNGVVISGGTHYVGNQAVGHRAQAFSGSVSFQPQEGEQTARTVRRERKRVGLRRPRGGP